MKKIVQTKINNSFEKNNRIIKKIIQTENNYTFD